MQRWRCVLEKYFGAYYRRELKGDELRKAWHQAFEVCDAPMSTESELAQYIKSVGRPRFDRGADLQWKVHLVKNFKDTSVLVFKINHWLCDGIGTVLMASSLQNVGKPSPKHMPFIRDLTDKDKNTKLASLITLPYYLAK